ncbi:MULTISPECIES: hypothetical protein [unclassified Nodularia (in: cyanobacteria)]|uniref:hypothetical protein n=1 Tax=unclassified Nodularia (in: cyanobacteria) TaxID=2656917 RepID=UPI001881941B|nr:MULTISPECIES: hypothetical protein [unclassified Nodularia (in: cyanobacteria)]MBE9199285.1 hypothetical protein [Nodularia sp. LEGE 06071]MCC2693697.1 hypothetical protein [Nodularia sp. LEGE 04288]
MHKARHIRTGRIVLASTMESGDYFGIFQCPYCKTDLILTQEYKTKYGKIVSAFFKHREAENDFQKKCPLRVENNSDKSNKEKKSNKSKEQNLERLKQEVILSLKNRNDTRITYQLQYL